MFTKVECAGMSLKRNFHSKDEAARKARCTTKFARCEGTPDQDLSLKKYIDDRIAGRVETDSQNAEAAFKVCPQPSIVLPPIPVLTTCPRTVEVAPQASAPAAMVNKTITLRIVGDAVAEFDLRVSLDWTYGFVCDMFAALHNWDYLTVSLTNCAVEPDWKDTLFMLGVKDGDEVRYVVIPPIAVKVCNVDNCDSDYPDLVARETRSFECHQDKLVKFVFLQYAAEERRQMSEYQFTLNGAIVPPDVTVGSLNLGEDGTILCRRFITLLIIDKAGTKMYVRMKVSSKMTALLHYMHQNGYCSVSDLVGVRIKNSDTPNSLRMTDQSTLYVFKPSETIY